jgi:hypothetical protein
LVDRVSTTVPKIAVSALEEVSTCVVFIE